MSQVVRRRPLRIAMIGQRGVPASFGGIEHHVEEVGSRLATRGHDVTVFARRNYLDTAIDEHRGMRVRVLPTVGTKHLDAIAHSALSTVAALRRPPDIVHYHAVGPGLCAPLPRVLSRSRVVVTVHGPDYDQAKWGRGAKSVLRTARWMSARVPDATVVVAPALARFYADRYDRATHLIPNGVARRQRRAADRITSTWGLRAGEYLLFVGRLIPDKSPDLLLRAFRRVSGDVRLVLAGGTSFTDEYARAVEDEAARDPRVLLPGYVYGEVLDELYTNALAFVQPSALEGMPLTVLEAAAYGTPVIASDIPAHTDLLGQDAPGQRLFRSGDEAELHRVIEQVRRDPGPERDGAARLRSWVLSEFPWDRTATELEELYFGLVRGSSPPASVQ
jgi:glycosyltransferase involved in cell wall biosynthesis